MPDLSYEKLIFFLFAALPGFIALQVYNLKCPIAKRDWGSSLVEIVTYSLINLTIWLWWVVPLVRTPIDQVNWLVVTLAVVCVCFVSPTVLALLWHWLRTSILHQRLRMDHPTPRGWDHFIRNNHCFWVLFHLKNEGPRKMLGGFFGENSYAALFPQEPEIYVEEIWRVNDEGEIVEKVEDTLGGVIRLSECERVEFFSLRPEVTEDGVSEKGDAGLHLPADRGAAGEGAGREAGCEAGAEQQSEAAEGRIRNGVAEGTGQVN